MNNGSKLPTINIRALQHSDPAMIETLRTAASDTGFFLIEGMEQDIPAELAAHAFREAANLFAQSHEILAKMTLDRTMDPSNRGFEGLGSQSLNPSTRIGLGDLNASFRCTEDRDPRLDTLLPKPAPIWGEFYNKPNKWPDQAAMPHFKAVKLAYLRGAGNVAEIIFRGLERAFDMEAGFLVNKHRRRLFTLRDVYYPKLVDPIQEGQVGCGTHTDFGTITLVRRKGSGCLRVRRRNGEWIEVRPPSEAMIVNIGDMLQWWTNGKLISTAHGVDVGQDDYSIVVFCYADFWEKLRGEVTAGEYLHRKLTESYRHAVLVG
jgi:isopenicillin N synthase-like dioxygenase